MQCSYVKHTWIHKCLCELNSKAVCITGFYCHAGWVLVSFHPIGGLLMLELSSARRWWAIPDPRIRLPQGSSFAPLKIHGLVGPPPPPPEQITALTVEKELRLHRLRLLFYFFSSCLLLQEEVSLSWFILLTLDLRLWITDSYGGLRDTWYRLYMCDCLGYKSFCWL